MHINSCPTSENRSWWGNITDVRGLPVRAFVSVTRTYCCCCRVSIKVPAQKQWRKFIASALNVISTLRRSCSLLQCRWAVFLLLLDHTSIAHTRTVCSSQYVFPLINFYSQYFRFSLKGTTCSLLSKREGVSGRSY